jgi:hypothetical protein
MTLPSGACIPIKRLPEWGLYGSVVEPIVPAPLCPSPPTIMLTSASSRATTQLWHRRLGHIHGEGLRRIVSLVDGIPESMIKAEFCGPCALSKSKIADISKLPGSRNYPPFHTINMDSWGPVEPSLHGNN